MTPDGDAPSVVVVGGGVAGLTAAFDLAVAGHRVTVLEASAAFGGTVGRAVIDGLAVDVGAESFAIAVGTVQQLISDLGLTDDVVRPRPAPAWVRSGAVTAPLPGGGWMGVPSRPLAADVRRVIGWPGAVRALADRVLPARIGRSATSLGGLVRTRMGSRVLDRLVEPVVGGVYSTPPTELPLTRLPPRARQALSDSRSLQDAAVAIRGGTASAGAQVAGLTGGMYTLVEHLVEAIRAHGGELFTDVGVTALRPDGGAWTVQAGDGSWTTDAVVLAGSATTSRLLLGLPAPENTSSDVLLCTLVVESDALDAAPRGSGMLVASGVPDVGAKAMTHATAKWQWLADAAGPGRHVLRLSYGRVGDRQLPDERAFPQLALADAAALLGVPLTPGHLRGHRLDRWPVTGPADSAAPTTPATVVVTGGWLAGTGLAAVIGHARVAAAQLTSQAGVRSTAAGQVLQ